MSFLRDSSRHNAISGCQFINICFAFKFFHILHLGLSIMEGIFSPVFYILFYLQLKTPWISSSFFLIGYECLTCCQDGHDRRKDMHLTDNINFHVFIQACHLTSASRTGFQIFFFSPFFAPHVSLLHVYHIKFFFQQD